MFLVGYIAAPPTITVFCAKLFTDILIAARAIKRIFFMIDLFAITYENLYPVRFKTERKF